jgi:prevent-host-death family protein
MKQVSLYEAKTHLSKLVDEAAAGEEIVIAKNGKPKARLSPITEAPKSKEPRKLGQWAVQNKPIDWDEWWRDWKALDKEIEADFEAAIDKPFPSKGHPDLKGRRGFGEGGTAAPVATNRSKRRTNRSRARAPKGNGRQR